MHACIPVYCSVPCVPEFLTFHLDTVPVHSGMVRGSAVRTLEDRLARQINNGSRIRHSFIRSPRSALALFLGISTRGEESERAAASRPIAKTTRALCFQSGADRVRAARGGNTTQRHAAASKDSGTAIITAGAPPALCACDVCLPCFHRSAAAPRPKNIPTHQILAPQSFCLEGI